MEGDRRRPRAGIDFAVNPNASQWALAAARREITLPKLKFWARRRMVVASQVSALTALGIAALLYESTQLPSHLATAAAVGAACIGIALLAALAALLHYRRIAANTIALTDDEFQTQYPRLVLQFERHTFLEQLVTVKAIELLPLYRDERQRLESEEARQTRRAQEVEYYREMLRTRLRKSSAATETDRGKEPRPNIVWRSDRPPKPVAPPLLPSLQTPGSAEAAQGAPSRPALSART